MAEIVENSKGFKVIKMSSVEVLEEWEFVIAVIPVQERVIISQF